MIAKFLRSLFQTEGPPNFESEPESPVSLNASLFENMIRIHGDFGSTADLIVREFDSCGYKFACISMENMIEKEPLNRQVIEKIIAAKRLPDNAKERFEYIESHVSTSPDQKRILDFESLYYSLMSGCAVLLCDGMPAALVISVQGYPARSVEPPQTEVMERGSHEGFVEVLKENMAMIRRRLKTTELKFEMMQIGTKSRTDVAICYLSGVVSDKVLRDVKRRLNAIEIDMVLESGYLQPFLGPNRLSFFTSVGTSERPDTVCGKLSEGRVAILVDGTPFCLIVPHLFSEHFQSLDDYAMNPFFVTFIRGIKYLAFFLSIMVPGFYVALCEHNPEMFPSTLLYKVFDSEVSTPFPSVWEALIIHIIYEIMREAGLRLPKSVGHAVSIVGGLVIGEAAVTAGLIGAPMIIVVATTALSSFVVPSLYYQCALLRLAAILIGGATGVLGVVLLMAIIIVAICSQNVYGIPLSSPISPFDISSTRDTLFRAGWRTLSRKVNKVQNLHGTNGEIKK